MQGLQTVALCALLAILPLAGSSGQGTYALHASQAKLTGDGAATANLAGMVIQGQACGNELVMSLAATQGTLEVDNETADAWVTPTVAGPRTNTRETIPISGAVAEGFQLRGSCRILAIPLPGAGLHAAAALGPGQFLPPATGAMEFQPRASFDRKPIGIPAGTLPFEATRSGALQIQAPFQLVVWDSLFALHDGNRTRNIQTGAEAQPLGPGVPAQREVQREAYFTVEEGTLALSLGPGVRLYAASLQLEVQAGRLQLQDPEGSLPIRNDPIPNGSKLLELEGPVAVLLEPRTGRLDANVEGDPAAVFLDGTEIAQPAPGQQRALLQGAVGIAVLALAFFQVARVRTRRRMAQVDDLLDARRYPEALALARKAKSHGGRREEARLAEATCLIQLSRFSEAREALADRGWSVTSRPLRDYLMANVEAGSGRISLAVKHLSECLLKAPAFATEALVNPLLAPVVRDALAATQPPVPGESYA